jgi:hypothetical protein
MKFSLDICRNMQMNIRHYFCITLITRHIPIVLTTEKSGMDICDVITQITFQQDCDLNPNLITCHTLACLVSIYIFDISVHFLTFSM